MDWRTSTLPAALTGWYDERRSSSHALRCTALTLPGSAADGDVAGAIRDSVVRFHTRRPCDRRDAFQLEQAVLNRAARAADLRGAAPSGPAVADLLSMMAERRIPSVNHQRIAQCAPTGVHGFAEVFRRVVVDAQVQHPLPKVNTLGVASSSEPERAGERTGEGDADGDADGEARAPDTADDDHHGERTTTMPSAPPASTKVLASLPDDAFRCLDIDDGARAMDSEPEGRDARTIPHRAVASRATPQLWLHGTAQREMLFEHCRDIIDHTPLPQPVDATLRDAEGSNAILPSAGRGGVTSVSWSERQRWHEDPSTRRLACPKEPPPFSDVLDRIGESELAASGRAAASFRLSPTKQQDVKQRSPVAPSPLLESSFGPGVVFPQLAESLRAARRRLHREERQKRQVEQYSRIHARDQKNVGGNTSTAVPRQCDDLAPQPPDASPTPPPIATRSSLRPLRAKSQATQKRPNPAARSGERLDRPLRLPGAYDVFKRERDAARDRQDRIRELVRHVCLPLAAAFA